MVIEYKPQHVCSQKYIIDVNDGIINNIEVIGGCQGNLHGISSLLKGMKVEEAIARLEGIKCRGSRTRETSCPDQIARALKSI